MVSALYLFTAVFLIRACSRCPPSTTAVTSSRSGTPSSTPPAKRSTTRTTHRGPHYLWSPGATALLSPSPCWRTSISPGGSCAARRRLTGLPVPLHPDDHRPPDQPAMAVAVIATFARPGRRQHWSDSINGFPLMVLLVLMSLSDVSDRHAWARAGSAAKIQRGHRPATCCCAAATHRQSRPGPRGDDQAIPVSSPSSPVSSNWSSCHRRTGRHRPLHNRVADDEHPMDYVDNLPYLGEPRSTTGISDRSQRAGTPPSVPLPRPPGRHRAAWSCVALASLTR